MTLLNKEPTSKIEQLVLLIVKQLGSKPFPINFKTSKTEVIKKLEREGIRVLKIEIEGEEKFYIVKGSRD